MINLMNEAVELLDEDIRQEAAKCVEACVREVNKAVGIGVKHFKRGRAPRYQVPYILISNLPHAPDNVIQLICYNGRCRALYGYDSHEGFTRAFKAYFGVTPSEYRKCSNQNEMEVVVMLSNEVLKIASVRRLSIKSMEPSIALDFFKRVTLFLNIILLQNENYFLT